MHALALLDAHIARAGAGIASDGDSSVLSSLSTGPLASTPSLDGDEDDGRNWLSEATSVEDHSWLSGGTTPSSRADRPGHVTPPTMSSLESGSLFTASDDDGSMSLESDSLATGSFLSCLDVSVLSGGWLDDQLSSGSLDTTA